MGCVCMYRWSSRSHFLLREQISSFTEVTVSLSQTHTHTRAHLKAAACQTDRRIMMAPRAASAVIVLLSITPVSGKSHTSLCLWVLSWSEIRRIRCSQSGVKGRPPSLLRFLWSRAFPPVKRFKILSENQHRTQIFKSNSVFDLWPFELKHCSLVIWPRLTRVVFSISCHASVASVFVSLPIEYVKRLKCNYY